MRGDTDVTAIPASVRDQWNAIPAEPPSGSQSPPLHRRKQPDDDSPVRKPKSKRTTGDRFKLLNTFIDFTLRDLSRNEITVWMILYRDAKDGVSRTSIADLSRRSGISTRTGIRSIASLERKGLLKIVHRGGLRKGVSTYRICPLTTEGT